ncbi:MAG TPA: glycoside hydrolase family 95 protein [Armatimonadota bacterium]
MTLYQPSQDILWFTFAAKRWLSALPLGNGRLGAMVFGGTEIDRLALNHENLWRGVTRHRTTEPKHQYLPEIREKLLAGQWVEGTELATQYLSGHDRRVQPYQPAGDLLLYYPGHVRGMNYRRSLDLANGIAEVTYRQKDITYRRETFVSAAHGVIVVRVTADQPGAVTLTAQLDRAADPACALRHWADGNRCGFVGHFDEDITFAMEARVTTIGGQVTPGEGATVRVTGADEALIVLTIAVDYNQPNPQDWCAAHLDGVPMDFTTLVQAHVTEHRALYDRVKLDIGHNPEAEALPTDQRLARMRAGGHDPGLIALYFQYGRYLLMDSSRNCDQPANLQGVWNEELRPPWDSDLHHDVNLQMNYWPAEVCNLGECAEPLFRYLQRSIPGARKAARDLYNCRGLFFGIQTDVWGSPTPEAPGWDVWIGGAAWLAEHLWWRFEYSQDETFLREQAYPFYKQVAEFYEDYLVRDAQGRLVPVPSQSPENAFVGGGRPVSLCVGATMDLALIRETLERCLHASDILGCDAKLRPRWEAILADLPPFQVGRFGQLQEWLEDFEEVEPGHRHFSHLIGVFPGELMTPETRPEFYRAARISLERRLAGGGGHTGWSRSWTALLWARFGEGKDAYEHMEHLLTDFSSFSMLDLHPSYDPPVVFQIDGNFGGTAAVAEMLLQSHGGVIRLLPALPPQIPTGTVSGLRARGGFVIDLRWADSAFAEARLLSEHGGPCRLTIPGACQVFSAGVPVETTLDEHGCLTFKTDAGKTYELTV